MQNSINVGIVVKAYPSFFGKGIADVMSLDDVTCLDTGYTYVARFPMYGLRTLHAHLPEILLAKPGFHARGCQQPATG